MTTLHAESDTGGKSEPLNQHLINQWGSQNWITILRNALVITRREVRDSFRDWRIIFPIFLLTLIFPMLANLGSNILVNLIETRGETRVEGLVDPFLPLMPMLMGFFPISISLVIALETFVGEKERMSLEPLLSTPLTNIELYIGKIIAAILPPLAAGYLGMSLYVGGQVFGEQQWRPEFMLIVLIYLLTTFQASVMVTGAVVISSQTTSTRAANLLASVIIVPMSLLVIIESIIMINPIMRHVLWWILAGQVVVVILFMRAGARLFNREELLGRSIDHLNFRWAWQTFISQWRTGEAKFSLFRWYRSQVFPSIRNLWPHMIVFVLCATGLFIYGWHMSNTYPLPLEGKDTYDEDVVGNLRNIIAMGEANPQFILMALAQNIRVLLLATFMASFTFGVMGVIVTGLPFGVFGYVIGNIIHAGLDPTPFFVAILGHGVLEIPAILIAGAAAFRLGAIFARPPENTTISEIWLRTFADTLKIGIAVVLPLLIFAAILEVQLTPHIVEWVLTR